MKMKVKTMVKEMVKFEIGGRKEFLAVIDEIGSRQAKIKSLKRQVDVRLAAAAAWASEHPAEAFPDGGHGRTEKYDYLRKQAPRAVRRLPDVTLEQVVALLRADEAMAKYVVASYDTKEIGRDFGGSRERRESVKAFGLCFTDPGKDGLEVLS